jgi:hypothetical protein
MCPIAWFCPFPLHQREIAVSLRSRASRCPVSHVLPNYSTVIRPIRRTAFVRMPWEPRTGSRHPPRGRFRPWSVPSRSCAPRRRASPAWPRLRYCVGRTLLHSVWKCQDHLGGRRGIHRNRLVACYAPGSSRDERTFARPTSGGEGRRGPGSSAWWTATRGAGPRCRRLRSIDAGRGRGCVRPRPATATTGMPSAEISLSTGDNGAEPDLDSWGYWAEGGSAEPCRGRGS